MENSYIFKNWTEVAIGIQNNWLNYKNLTRLWDKGVISIADKDSYADLYFAEQTSKEQVLLVLSKIIQQQYHIKTPVDRHGLCIDYTLKEFENGLKIWEYHFLYPVYTSNKPISEKLEDDLYYLWMDFKYFNVAWGAFLWIAASRLNKSIKELYTDFEKYVKELSEYLESR